MHDGSGGADATRVAERVGDGIGAWSTIASLATILGGVGIAARMTDTFSRVDEPWLVVGAVAASQLALLTFAACVGSTVGVRVLAASGVHVTWWRSTRATFVVLGITYVVLAIACAASAPLAFVTLGLASIAAVVLSAWIATRSGKARWRRLVDAAD